MWNKLNACIHLIRNQFLYQFHLHRVGHFFKQNFRIKVSFLFILINDRWHVGRIIIIQQFSSCSAFFRFLIGTKIFEQGFCDDSTKSEIVNFFQRLFPLFCEYKCLSFTNWLLLVFFLRCQWTFKFTFEQLTRNMSPFR